MNENDFLKAALAYAAQGYFVFPLKPRDKIPLTTNGYKDATTKPERITSWWTQWPNANIGVPTGAINGFWVLDVDGAEGEASLKALEASNNVLPPTLEVVTGGGGRHLYFVHPQGLQISNSAGKVGLKIDVRGDGGYIVAPPSIHNSGRKYEWSVDSLETSVQAPAWLIGLVMDKPKTTAGKSDVDWESLLEGVLEGNRNKCAAKLSGKLLAHGLETKFSFYLLAAWNDARCKPPLPHQELLKTFLSIAQRNFNKKGAF